MNSKPDLAGVYTVKSGDKMLWLLLLAKTAYLLLDYGLCSVESLSFRV